MRPFRPFPKVLVVVAALVLCAPMARADVVADDLRSLLRGDVVLRLAGRALDRAALTQIYETRDFAPIWVGTPEREAALRAALAEAPAHGLDAGAFAIPDVGESEREVLLTDAFLRYAAAFAQGRVSAADFEDDWALRRPDFDAAAALERAATGEVAGVLHALTPDEPRYARLQAALARYEALAAAGGWPTVPNVGKLKLGDNAAAVLKLRRRLAIEGYLDDPAPSRDFDEAVEAAVKRFQAQHGIAVDGHVGPSTLEALNRPASVRVEQIKVNLERWRESPRHWPATRIEVNVPAAWLTVVDHGETAFGMRAIVGAENHPTPVLRAYMNAVLFNPPWNVPDSIVKKEILPHLRQDPRYLEHNHYVWLGRPRASAVQQLPGADNALGRVKFELPNVYDVYLHDTSSHPLFSRVVRTLSHGCVRLEEPRQLALYVLAGKTGFATQEEVDGAIALGTTQRVSLPRTLPVYLIYWTAFVDDDGGVEFRDDIYGRDLRLAAAMAKRDAEEWLASPPPATVAVPVVRAGAAVVVPAAAPGNAQAGTVTE
jgi:murein L,D-transpeptidase YcbB/YkuD